MSFQRTYIVSNKLYTCPNTSKKIFYKAKKYTQEVILPTFGHCNSLRSPPKQNISFCTHQKNSIHPSAWYFMTYQCNSWSSSPKQNINLCTHKKFQFILLHDIQWLINPVMAKALKQPPFISPYHLCYLVFQIILLIFLQELF